MGRGSGKSGRGSGRGGGRGGHGTGNAAKEKTTLAEHCWMTVSYTHLTLPTIA